MTKQTKEISNVMVYSNIMACKPDDEEEFKKKEKWKAGIPGDLYIEIFSEYKDSRIIKSKLTPKQLQEYRTYLPCLKCGKHCAGTCE